MTVRPPVPTTVGFIGVGVMGEPMCRNLFLRRNDIGAPKVLAYDIDKAPLKRLAVDGVVTASSVAELVRQSEVVFLSLPSGKLVEEISLDANGIFAHCAENTVVIDLSTTPVDLTRSLAAKFAKKDVDFMDAPVTRTRHAAALGTLAIMAAGTKETFTRIEPLLRCFATDITYCGPSGCGQMAKILNSMVLFQNVAALAEALTVARKSGMDGEVLFQALSNGSADSFALRNHGMKALLPGVFPEQAFSTLYATKDLDYALDLAKEAEVTLPGAENVRRLLTRAAEQGFGENYWPVILKVLEPEKDPD